MLRTVVLSVFVAGYLGSALATPPLVEPEFRIFGGIPVNISEHPYQVNLQTTKRICGGSIISAKWIVTAARCVGRDPNQYTVRVGSNHKDQGTRYTIKRIIKHFDYQPDINDYDIALVEVEGSIKLGDNVQPVQLANSEPQPGTVLNVTGWGSTRMDGPFSPILMKVSVPLVDRKICEERYQNFNLITARMICAGVFEGGKGPCFGDHGGPLTANGVLYGIASWFAAYGCARPAYPGVYSNVANLRSWIKENSGV